MTAFEGGRTNGYKMATKSANKSKICVFLKTNLSISNLIRKQNNNRGRDLKRNTCNYMKTSHWLDFFTSLSFSLLNNNQYHIHHFLKQYQDSRLNYSKKTQKREQRERDLDNPMCHRIKADANKRVWQFIPNERYDLILFLALACV